MTSTFTKEQVASTFPSGWEWKQEQTQNGSRGVVTKDFVFPDFTRAFSFMSCVANYADKVDHHPEWFNVYNLVKVKLSTHTTNSVTEKDLDLANALMICETAPAASGLNSWINK